MAKILIVDDERGIRLTLRAFLQDEGHQVSVATDSNEAFRALEHESFDLIVADDGLPGLSGRELIRRLREAGLEGTYILMSGDLLEDDLEDLQAPVVERMLKPITGDMIRLAVRRSLAVNPLQ